MDADRKKKLIACLMLMINEVGVLATVDNGDLIQEMVCNDDSLRKKRDRYEMERSEMATMKNLLFSFRNCTCLSNAYFTTPCRKSCCCAAFAKPRNSLAITA